MRRIMGLLLVLTQLGPLAGAGLCLHMASQSAEHCAAPMEGMSTEQAPPSSPGPAHDCALMSICAAAAPVVPESIVQALSTSPRAFWRYSNPPSLLPGDPIAPPQPPPIV